MAKRRPDAPFFAETALFFLEIRQDSRANPSSRQFSDNP